MLSNSVALPLREADPTCEAMGAAAPALLLVARQVQGLSVGGEYGTEAPNMIDIAGTGNRGFYSPFQYVTLIGGQLLALLVLVVLQTLLSVDESWFSWYVTALAGVAFVASLMLPDSRRNSYLDGTWKA